MNKKSDRRISKSSPVHGAVVALLQLGICLPPAEAQGIEHGMKMMAEMQGTDSSGFPLMVVSIFIIMGCALTLITITAMYSFKGKRKKR